MSGRSAPAAAAAVAAVAVLLAAAALAAAFDLWAGTPLQPAGAPALAPEPPAATALPALRDDYAAFFHPWQAAERHFAAGELAAARAAAEAALSAAVGPEIVEVRLLLADIYEEQGQWSAAARELLALLPDSELRYRGYLRDQLAYRLENALGQLDLSDADQRRELLGLDVPPAAAAAARAAEALADQVAELLQAGDPAPATALVAPPGEPAAELAPAAELFPAAAALYADGQTTAAVGLLRRRAAVEPTWQAHAWLGIWEAAAGRRRLALAEMARALEHFGPPPWPRVLLEGLYPRHFADAVGAAARAYDVDPLLLLSIMREESSFEPLGYSTAGAHGLMQIMPATGQWLAELRALDDFRVARLFEPDLSIDLGAWYLGWLLARYDGDHRLAAAAYNAGQGNVDAWLSWHDPADAVRFVEAIPFAETRAYVEHVDAAYRMYRLLYAGAP